MHEQQRRQARVMVVDDEPQNVRYVIDVLTWAGYENLEGLTDPVEAVSRFLDYRPDLVILDLLMPGLDGFDAMEAMHEQLPGDEYLPFLILTSDISSESRRRALSSGAKDFLTKPMSPTEVRLRVDNLLETRFLYLELAARSSDGREEVEAHSHPTGPAPGDHEEVLERWGASLEALLPAAEGSSKRVGWLSARIAEALEMSSETVDRIGQAALLHLLGARRGVAVGGTSDRSAWTGVQTDPGAGARILAGTSLPVLETAHRMLSGLEEHWDGSGQPAGARGEGIPIEARIVAAARYWDESHGPGGESTDAADIETLSGTRFDPDVVAALLRSPAARTGG